MSDPFINWNPFGDAEPFPGETLVADGWVYRDFRPMLAKFWDDLLAIFGEGNYRLVTLSIRERDGQTFKRGQMFISPAGMANVQAYAKAKAN